MNLVELMTRKGCHLCDDVKGTLLRVRARHPFELVEKDIDEDEALLSLYDHEVPVVLLDGQKIAKYRLDEQLLVRRLTGGA